MLRREIEYCPMHAAAPDMAARIAELKHELKVANTNFNIVSASADRRGERIAELEAETNE